jgi:flagellar hook-associated protein 3 FlgL
MIRISTSTIFDTNVSAMNQQQASLLHTQMEVSSGKRIMTPADDPAGAAQAIEVTQSDATNTQFATNRNAATASLSLSEGVLQSVTTLIQNVQTTAVSAGNGSLNNSDRQTMATNLQQQLDQLIGLANSKDGSGNYLFAGSQGNTQPFVMTASGVQYQGDTGQHLIQVASSRQMVVNANGSDLFMSVKDGNGAFVTSANSNNTGSGVISQGNLAVPPPTPAQQGNTYQLAFTVTTSGTPPTPQTTYTVTGTDASGAPLPATSLPAANQSYTSGQSISFNGLQFDIQGTPASGDTFTVAPSTTTSLFKTIQNLISTLNTPIPPGNAAASAAFTQQLDTAMNGLDQGLNKVLTGRAAIGSNLSELTTLQSTGSALGLQYQTTLSQLQNVDFNQAISQLSQQQLGLQAAMQSFKTVSSLSLFNYM